MSTSLSNELSHHTLASPSCPLSSVHDCKTFKGYLPLWDIRSRRTTHVARMMDFTDKILALSGTCSGIVAVFVYWMYRKSHETADQIKITETVKLGKELEQRLQSLDDHRIAYATVEGVVKDLGKVFTSRSGDKQGVVLESQLVEHSSRRTQGFWSDVKKVLRHTLDVAPFALASTEKSGGYQIVVTEPAEAENLVEELEVTHNEFTPHTRSIVQASIDRIFGEVCRGIQETERMLLVGTSILGVGEIFLQDGHVKLGPPLGMTYILTKQTKNQLVRQYRSKGTFYKWCTIILCSVAVGMLAVFIWRVARKYWHRLKMKRMFTEIQRLASRSRENRANEELTEEQTCVICLANPREVITLECGHISLCSDCAQRLPEPKTCPVCRQNIERFLPVYRP